MMIVKHRSVSFLLLFFMCLVLFPGQVQSKTDESETLQKWANVEGFRSAQFGMSERDVLRAIFKDFKINRKKVVRFEHPIEKTISLGIDAQSLLPDSGPAKIFYILGHKSKRLMHINILWGKPATDKPDPENVVSIANQLRNHLGQKTYKREGFAVNAQLAEGVILVFQGQDKKGRAVKLVLINPKSDSKKVGENISLTLSYIEKPGKPDVFRIKDGEF